MILWTIQTHPAWKEFEQKGLLRTNPKFSEEYFISAYDWMVNQMELRLPLKPPEVVYPLWAWYQWQEERKRPDLRSAGHLPPGEKGVRIEFEIDENSVLLSDFDLWHYVLNYCYLSETEEEGEVFEKELKEKGLSFYRDKPLQDMLYHKKIEKSWEKIFDISPGKTYSIQATFWELYINQIRDIRFFRAR